MAASRRCLQHITNECLHAFAVKSLGWNARQSRYDVEIDQGRQNEEMGPRCGDAFPFNVVVQRMTQCKSVAHGAKIQMFCAANGVGVDGI